MAPRTRLGEIGTYGSGLISVDRDDDQVLLTVHWPFDRSTDEWVDLRVRLPIAAVRESISSAFARDQLRVETVEPGQSVALRRSPGRQSVVFVGDNAVGPVQLEARLEDEDLGALVAALERA